MDKTSSDAYATLAACMTLGKHVSLRLRGGETVAKYRCYDVIAPTGFEIHVDMSEAVLRGIVWTDREERIDRHVRLPDLETVREENLSFRYVGEAEFSNRNPIPEGWVRVGSCPLQPRPARLLVSP